MSDVNVLTQLTSTLAASPTLAAIGIAALVLFFGFRFLAGLKSDSPFSPYAIQILALIVVLPIVLTLALATKFPTEAATGLLGTIVGFFFGGAHTKPPSEKIDRGQRTRQQLGKPSAGTETDDQRTAETVVEPEP